MLQLYSKQNNNKKNNKHSGFQTTDKTMKTT